MTHFVTTFEGSGAGHGCRNLFDHINHELNPNHEALKYMECDMGGFVRLQIDTEKVEMQAFYYVSTSKDIQFFSGIWDKNGNYTTIDEILSGAKASSRSKTNGTFAYLFAFDSA